VNVLVTGSRTWSDAGYIHRVLDALLAVDGEVVLFHGSCALGADELADQWALSRMAAGANVTINRFPAKWRDGNGIFDKGAGFKRNAQMLLKFGAAGIGGQVHAFVREKSNGASHTAKLARRAGLATTVHRWEDREARS
jgi:hypothetical protein